MEVSGDSADSEGDARVLDTAIGVEKPCPDCTDFGSQGVTDEFLKPKGGDDFHIVVQECEYASTGVGGTEVLDCGVIEGAVVGEDADIRMGIELTQVGQGVWIGGLVVDDQNFPGRVMGAVEDAFDTGAEDGVLVTGRDQDAHKGRSFRERPSYPQGILQEPGVDSCT